MHTLAVIAGDLTSNLRLTFAGTLIFTFQIGNRWSCGSAKLTFEEFVSAGPRMRNTWVREPGISIYIRKPTGFGHNADYELASMEADVPGSGSLTSFLERYEPTYSFYIENLLHDQLVSFFARRGYRVVGGNRDDLDICMITARCWHFKDDVHTTS